MSTALLTLLLVVLLQCQCCNTFFVSSRLSTLLKLCRLIVQHNCIPKLSLPCCRPAELVAGMSACLEKMCIAEAQALTALRAEQKGNSNGVIASLHVGASDMFETASKILKQNTGRARE